MGRGFFSDAPKIPLCIMVYPQTAKQLKERAARCGISISTMGEIALMEYLAKGGYKMTLLETIQSNLKKARQDKKPQLVKFWGLVLSEVKNIEKQEVSEKDKLAGAIALTDQNIIPIIRKLIKSCQVSAEQAREHDREDAVQKAESEKELLLELIPENQRELEEADLRHEIMVRLDTLMESGETNPKALRGKVFGLLNCDFKGRFDGKLASDIISEILSQK